MRRLTLTIALALGALILLGHAMASLAGAATPGRQMAVAEFTDKTLLASKLLQGKYILVHDDEMKARGEACFYVYAYSADQKGKPVVDPDKLVVSFHCLGVERPAVRDLVMTFTPVAGKPDTFELREIQFEGSTVGHRVP